MYICLVAIVKNEAKVIKRMIDSVKPLITKWCIVDTGSTDGTQEIVRSELKDLPGELYEREFTDFSTDRNFALEKAREQGTDYLLILDADEVLTATITNFVMPELKADAYAIRMKIGAVNQTRLQLIKSSASFKYVGRAHEVLNTSEKLVIDMLNGLLIVSLSDGATMNKDIEKHAKYAELLEQDLADDPNNLRAMFYLAGQYRSCGKYQEALDSLLWI